MGLAIGTARELNAFSHSGRRKGSLESIQNKDFHLIFVVDEQAANTLTDYLSDSLVGVLSLGRQEVEKSFAHVSS